jgi:hypothetical protein
VTSLVVVAVGADVTATVASANLQIPCSVLISTRLI